MRGLSGVGPFSKGPSKRAAVWGVKQSKITIRYRFSQPNQMPVVLPQSHSPATVVRLPSQLNTIGDHIRRKRLRPCCAESLNGGALCLLVDALAARGRRSRLSVRAWDCCTDRLHGRILYLGRRRSRRFVAGACFQSSSSCRRWSCWPSRYHPDLPLHCPRSSRCA